MMVLHSMNSIRQLSGNSEISTIVIYIVAEILLLLSCGNS